VTSDHGFLNIKKAVETGEGRHGLMKSLIDQQWTNPSPALCHHHQFEFVDA
jgi:hypothetical protein